MTSIETLREFLGWCTVLNMGMLAFAALAIVVAGKPIKKLHSSLFDLPSDELPRAYFQYLAQYKIAVFIFNLVPYTALHLID